MIILGEVLSRLKRFHKEAEVKDLVAHVSRIDWNLSAPPFKNIIWDPAAQRMITGTKVLCRDFVLFVVGEDSVHKSVVQKYSKTKGVALTKAENYVGSLPRLEVFDG